MSSIIRGDDNFDTEKAIVEDANGNVGIGVVPEAWQAGWTAQQIGARSNTVYTAGGAFRTNNAYRDSVNSRWEYQATDQACMYELSDSGTHTFYVAPSGTADTAISWTTAMTVDNGGNVGIGTSSPSAPLHVNNSGSSACRLYLENTGNTSAGDTQIWSQNNDLAFNTAGSERLRISADGNVLVGTSGTISGFFPAKIQIDAAGNNGIVVKTTTAGEVALASWDSTASGSGTRYHCNFYDSGSRTQRGSITTNGSTVTYGSNSDYRLKTNVTPMTGATAAVKLLKPCNFDWIESGVNVDGFLAHELAEVVPAAATGTKDAMMDEEYEVTPATGDVFTAGSEAGFTEVSAAVKAEPAYYDVDGNVIKAEVIAQAAVHEAYEAVAEVIHSADVEQPETLEEGQQWRDTTPAVMGTRSVPDMQGIDQSKLVPLLTATIQELIARIETLEGAQNMITVDMTKAKVIAHDSRRVSRNAAFAPLDIKATIPAEATAAEEARVVIRDNDTALQTQMDAASDADALKALMPAGE